MNASAPQPKQASGNAKRIRRAQATGGKDLGRACDREVRRVAAAVLEVLAGARTPTEAAQALGLSVPRYYQVESQALQGLLAGCTPKARGPVRSVDKELQQLRQDNQRLQREVSRHQALARAAQRTIGLLPPPLSPPTAKSGKKMRKRRVARALSVAARLQQQNAEAAPPTEASDRTEVDGGS
jgi:hypothetical protein